MNKQAMCTQTHTRMQMDSHTHMHTYTRTTVCAPLLPPTLGSFIATQQAHQKVAIPGRKSVFPEDPLSPSPVQRHVRGKELLKKKKMLLGMPAYHSGVSA